MTERQQKLKALSLSCVRLGYFADVSGTTVSTWSRNKPVTSDVENRIQEALNIFQKELIEKRKKLLKLDN